jgi:hypothetical protein
MKYSELIQAYFERSVALQGYWTIYVLVIGGVLAFSAFRQQKDFVTTVLVSLLYIGFAYKNLGAIEATLGERQALVTAIKQYPASGVDTTDLKRIRDVLEPTLTWQEYEGVRNFHVTCDLLTIAFLLAREVRRKKTELATAGRSMG